MKKRYMFLTIIVLLLLIIFAFLRYGGRILVADDDTEHVEDAVIVLLMGSVGDRALGAADLYEMGKANQILLVHSHIMGDDVLQERGITIPGSAEISRDILIESQIPEDDITIFPGDAESTKDEASIIAEHFEQFSDVENIILVTSKYHSFRSKQIFENALDDFDVNIYSEPTSYDTFNPNGWYRDREDIQVVVSEYTKILHYYLLEQFKI